MRALNCWRMSPPRLDEDPFCFDFTDEFLAEFGFCTAGGFATTTGVPGDDDGDVEAPFFSFGSYSHEFDDASFTSLLRVTWGIPVIAARSVGLIASIAKRIVSKNPVGIVNF